MPVYIWKCEKCEQNSEVQNTMANSDNPPKSCSHCNGNGPFAKVIGEGVIGSLSGRSKGFIAKGE